MRLYRIRLAGLEARALSRIGAAALLMVATLSGLALTLGLTRLIPIVLISGFVFGILVISVRIIGLHVLRWIDVGHLPAVAIYGAGAAGVQLAAALWQAREVRPAFFLDDNSHLQGGAVGGLPVHTPQELPALIQRHRLAQVVVAIPSLSKPERSRLLRTLSVHPVAVRILPTYPELMSGEGLLESLRPVSVEALIGRHDVSLKTPEMAKTYAGRVILVTGAGGSIGAELCRQVLQCAPARVVLFDQGEHNLYQIDRELRATGQGARIAACLGSVGDEVRVRQVVRDHGVDVILHAAAYKHVPMVEENELEGARNNVLGTQVVAQVAASEGLERFILVSSDKAVRPANVMGATKRMAELVVQDVQTRSDQTKFAMVRFGNVLGSSGSILPLFQNQIAQGGPVTVTHRDITRYFMTIPEAARLVLTAGASARGGDVFVLDMGEPQKIMDVARRMIALSGRTLRDPATGEGEIAIQITGLRRGEKLFEELFIDRDNLLPTPHPKILRAQERKLSQIEVARMLRDLRRAIDASDVEGFRALIRQQVDGYKDSERQDLVV